MERASVAQRKTFAGTGLGVRQSSLGLALKDDSLDKKEAMLKEMLQDKKEEEVKLADMECKLREFVLEVVKPTIVRNTKLQSETEILQRQLESQCSKLQSVYEEMETLKESSDMVLTFQGRLDAFGEQSRALEEKLTDHRISTVARIEKAEAAVEHQKSASTRLSRGMERVLQDIDGFTHKIKELEAAVDLCGAKSKEHIEIEIRRVDMSLQEIKDLHQTFANEVWGPEEPQEISPPSLRRLDMQMRKVRADLTEAMADLTELRRLDGDMTEVKQKLVTFFTQIDDLCGQSADLKRRIDKIALDTKNDNKRVSNLMAAFTANLMQDVRVGFSHEVKGLQESQQEMQKFVRETQALVAELERVVISTGKQVEANLRECRTDIDGLERKRRRDKQGLEEGLASVQGRAGAALEASEATLKGLEHISNVVSMSLQSDRMSVALDSTDFADRKESPYVGAHGMADKRKTGTNRGGLDPEILFRLTYQPRAVAFQGTNFDRQQLLALRERLVQTAQEVLARGPQGAAVAKSRKFPPGDDSPTKGLAGVDQVFAGAAELPSGRHSAPLVARPGSRGQPNARGSPLLADPFHGGGELALRAGAPTPPVAVGPAGKDVAEPTGNGAGAAAATRLPALSLGGAAPPRTCGTASTSASTPRPGSMGPPPGAPTAPLTAR